MTQSAPPPVRRPEPASTLLPESGGSRSVLLGNAAGHLFGAVARKPPRTLRINATMFDPIRPGGMLRAELVIAACPPLPGRSLNTDALTILEVLDSGEEEALRKDKLPAFRSLPGCREIVLIQDRRVYCEVHRRLGGGRWITDLLLDRESRLHLEGADLDLPLSVLYAQTGVAGA